MLARRVFIPRPVDRVYTRRHIEVSPCGSARVTPDPPPSNSTPNGSNVPGPGEQPNIPDDDGEDEVDPPVATATGKQGRGGIAGGRGRGGASKPLAKRRRY